MLGRVRAAPSAPDSWVVRADRAGADGGNYRVRASAIIWASMVGEILDHGQEAWS